MEYAKVERQQEPKLFELSFNFRTQTDAIPEFSGPWEERELGAVFCRDAIEVRNVYRHANLSSADMCESIRNLYSLN